MTEMKRDWFHLLVYFLQDCNSQDRVSMKPAAENTIMPSQMGGRESFDLSFPGWD